MDCDVEEPNGHIFLKPDIKTSLDISLPVPEVDLDKCTGCGLCGQICEFSAIVSVKSQALTFADLCHGCGGCTLVCPEEAIREVPRVIGVLEKGTGGDIGFVHGRLRIGEALSPPLIRRVKETEIDSSITIIDAPPGASCPAVEAVRNVDSVILVAESTPFGLHDLKIAVEMLSQMNLPLGVVINREGMGDDGVEKYCTQSDIPIYGKIPDDRAIAEAYSRGETIITACPELKSLFTEIYEQAGKGVL